MLIKNIVKIWTTKATPIGINTNIGGKHVDFPFIHFFIYDFPHKFKVYPIWSKNLFEFICKHLWISVEILGVVWKSAIDYNKKSHLGGWLREYQDIMNSLNKQTSYFERTSQDVLHQKLYARNYTLL